MNLRSLSLSRRAEALQRTSGKRFKSPAHFSQALHHLRGSPLLEKLRDVVLGHQVPLDGDVLLHGLAVDHTNRGLDSQGAHLIRLLGDGGVHRAVLNGVQGVFSAIEAGDLDVISGLVSEGLHGAQSHLVILGEDALDIRVGLHDVLRYGEPLGAVEVGGLAGHDLDGALSIYRFLEALTPVAGRVRARDAFELGDVAATDEPDQLFSCHSATLHVVRGYGSNYISTRRLTIQGDDRDACVVGRFDRGDDGVRIHRVHQNSAYLLGYEILDV